jgi:hypothetical protein
MDAHDVHTGKKISIFRVVILVTIIFITCYLIYLLFHGVKVRGEDFNQRQTHYHFNNLHGDTFDQEAKNVIEFGEAIDTPRAIDHLRIGTTYLINAHNTQRAQEHFRQALLDITDGKVDAGEAPFIIERIDDFKGFFTEDLPLQIAMEFIFENQKTPHVQYIRPEPNLNDPDYKEKHILAKQRWESDSQNVHDSALYTELKQQYEILRRDNNCVPDSQSHTFEECADWIALRFADQPDKLEKVRKVINKIEYDSPVSGIYKPNPDPRANGQTETVGEKDIITEIWKRIYDPRNSKNFNNMRESLGDAILDCVEGTDVVCLSGRCQKIWQATAMLDTNTNMGILRSRQMLRNEIIEKSAHIVKLARSNCADELRREYDTGQESVQVSNLMNQMKNKIDNLRGEYKGLLADDALDALITECKNAV